MEKSKHKQPKNETIHCNYDSMVNYVYLGLACEDNIPGVNEASSFEDLLKQAYPNPSERESKRAELGARFDSALTNFVVAAMALRCRNLEIDVGSDQGPFNNGHFPWEKPLMQKVRQLKRKKALSKDLTFGIIKAPTPAREKSQDFSSSGAQQQVGVEPESYRETLVA